MKTTIYQIITFLFFSFIIWIIYKANKGQESIFFELVAVIPYGDKVGHFFLFGCLTLLLNIAFKFKTQSFGKLTFYLGTLLVIIFVVLEELSQGFVSTRTLDIKDLLADGVGILIFSILSYFLSKRFIIVNKNNG